MAHATSFLRYSSLYQAQQMTVQLACWVIAICTTWCHTVKEERRLRVFKDREIRKVIIWILLRRSKRKGKVEHALPCKCHCGTCPNV